MADKLAHIQVVYANVADSALDEFVADLKNSVGVDPETTEIKLRSLDPPSWITFLAAAPWWQQALGAAAASLVVGALNKAGQDVYQSISNLVKKSDPLIEFASCLCRFCQRNRRIRLVIGIRSHEQFNGTTLPIECDSQIESKVALFVHHVPQLIELIENERILDKVFGGIYLQLFDNGALCVKWLEEGEHEAAPIERSETLLL